VRQGPRHAPIRRSAQRESLLNALQTVSRVASGRSAVLDKSPVVQGFIIGLVLQACWGISAESLIQGSDPPTQAIPRDDPSLAPR